MAEVKGVRKRAASSSELADFCMEVLEEGKAVDVSRLDLADKTSIADAFVLCAANSTPHIHALVERVKKDVSRKWKARPVLNGDAASGWVVMDYGDVVVHVMSAESREYYKIEDFWAEHPATDDEEALAKFAEAASGFGWRRRRGGANWASGDGLSNGGGG